MSTTDLPEIEDIAALLVALSDIGVRDLVLGRIVAAGSNTRLDLWIWLTRHADASHLVATAAVIAAVAAYRAGDGVTAGDALERALAAQPGHRLASMLLAALQAGIPPSALSALAAPDGADETPTGR
jgi:hypothetical protein